VHGWQCRLLESEIQQLQKETSAKEKEFCQQIEHLKKENHRQQKLIIQVCMSVVCSLCLDIYAVFIVVVCRCVQREPVNVLDWIYSPFAFSAH